MRTPVVNGVDILVSKMYPGTQHVILPNCVRDFGILILLGL